METTVKKREWVKDAAIVFLAVLLVLTFFSNTIMNRSLPEVATAAVSSGSIVARVRGSGVVTATGKQQVKAKETRTIRSVMVKVGQEVNTGDVLFVLGEGDETALEQAMNTLRALQYDYQRQAMNVPTYDGSSYDRSVDSAYERMVRAEQARNKAAEAYELALSRDSAANIQVTSAEIAQVEAQLKDISEQLSAAQAAYDERVNRAWEALSQAEWEYDHSGSEAEVYVDDEVLIDEDSGYQASTGGSEELWKKVEEARAHLSEVQNDIHLSSLQSQYDSLLERYNTLLQHRDNYTPDSVIPYQDALETAESELTDARLYYDEAVASRDYAYQSFEQKVAVEQVNLAETAENIRIQQEKIKSLAGEEENVVSAAVSGTISTIDCTAGDTVLKDALLCTIEVPDMGHTLSFSVTNDQAQRLRIGDTATVSNYYWGNSVTATLTTIRTDPKNPQTNKILTFDLVGDVTSGAEMSISVGQKSANYDLIVPNSAIKSDTNGSFVLLVSVKSSPLGNRYTAKRVSVEVLANDDNNSAVVADLSNGDYVITTSSAPVASGDMVRMADNA
ncbi:MAG: HlyD family efflux transporter periplasmic adaptor subunit [Oscillospiraceae bacterium]|nr:HlyD family efflux transporter periplasmic adaptor subunit [Oscillospiraceae bacterium]